jgi:hypothetical protein
MNTIQHPVTRRIIEISGTVGNVRNLSSGYVIYINNDGFPLDDEGKFACQVENGSGQFEMVGESRPTTREEAEAEAAWWNENDGNATVVEIEASWGTRSLG